MAIIWVINKGCTFNISKLCDVDICMCYTCYEAKVQIKQVNSQPADDSVLDYIGWFFNKYLLTIEA